jgi:hypothetical protein
MSRPNCQRPSGVLGQTVTWGDYKGVLSFLKDGKRFAKSENKQLSGETQ